MYIHIAYPWGSYNHITSTNPIKGEKTPDHQAFDGLNIFYIKKDVSPT